MITADREKSRQKVRRNDDRVNVIENMSDDFDAAPKPETT